MRTAIKLVCIIPALLLYALFALVIMALPAGGRLRRQFLARNTSFASKVVLAALGVRVHAKYRDRLRDSRKGRLIVANHVTYLDILVISSLVPSIFITSVELGGLALLGTLARLGGSMFVERRKRGGLKQEIEVITACLNGGATVVLFPEGTTSNGEQVHSFKVSLFDAAIRSGADVLPVCIRYTRVDGGPLTHENRDSVFYYGGMTFGGHVPRLIALRSIEVEVLPQKLIHAHHTSDRKEIAREAHEEISGAYGG